jgi:hypothetical protein
MGLFVVAVVAYTAVRNERHIVALLRMRAIDNGIQINVDLILGKDFRRPFCSPARGLRQQKPDAKQRDSIICNRLATKLESDL